MISTRSTLRKHAFSLVEVAIALVIFVIGALAIIQIFPSALGVINNNGDQLVANNLNRSVLAKLQSEKAMPDATFNLKRNSDAPIWTPNIEHADFTGATPISDWVPVPISVAGIPRFNMSLPSSEDVTNGLLDNSALGHYRAIQGEPCKTFTLGTADLYILTQFPIESRSVGSPGVLTPYEPIICTEIKKDDLIIKNTGQLEDETGTTYNVPADSLLYISYSYKSNYPTNSTWGVQDEPLRAGQNMVDPPGNQSGTAPGDVTYNGAAVNGVVAGDAHARLKTAVATGTFDEPGDAARGLVKVGIVTGLNAGDVVKVDYVADWATLLQDGVPSIVPDSGATDQRQIALGAPFIEDQSDNSMVTLLLENDTASRAVYANGALNSGSVNLIAPTDDDLKAGRATFTVMPNVQSRARVAYQTRDSWTQQLSVAATSYKPYVPAASSSDLKLEGWRDYVLGNNNLIYFHAGEAGKSVTVSYTVNVPGTGSVTINSRPFVVDENFAGASPLANFDSTGQSSILGLTAPNGDLLSADNAQAKSNGGTYLVSIQKVEGTSATVRTAYLNGSRYTQSLLTTNINRSFDQ